MNLFEDAGEDTALHYDILTNFLDSKAFSQFALQKCRNEFDLWQKM